MKIAIPLANEKMSPHFGHCEEFALIEVGQNKIVKTEFSTPPSHEPGALPQWLNQNDVEVIICGGMGRRAQGFFQDYGIKVILGAESEAPEKLVEQYLSGKLVTGDNICDH